jgi:hypothetical protein
MTHSHRRFLSALQCEDDRVESYVERPPLPGLAGVVRTVWIQRTGEAAYVQRHLPTGGVEIHFPIGGHPQLVGPLTGPEIEVIPAHTTIVGVRFQPGSAPPLPAVLDDLVDQRLGLAELWGSSGDRLMEAMAQAGTPGRALMFLQAHLLQDFRSAVRVDPLVREAVKVLMPWHAVDIDTLATHLALSASQLRRRCLHAVSRWLRPVPWPRVGVVRTAWRDWQLTWGTPIRHISAENASA